MVQALSQTITFADFIEWYPENSEYRYELRRGSIIERPKPSRDCPGLNCFYRWRLYPRHHPNAQEIDLGGRSRQMIGTDPFSA